MNLRQITDNVYYCGVNDRTTELFEGLWPLPFGVSYNSYLVCGPEKTALIDSVLESTAPAFFHNLGRQIESDKAIKPDYLIINHMEPDHSGSIPLLHDSFPDMKIVGNKITIGMVKSFYGLTDDELYIEVKDGDTLSLGGDMELQFFLTPMVHWPETMMTWLGASKVLFTGDGFGTFGALDGGVTDEQLHAEPYINEMYRYYSNIVGKYGPQVQKALAKVLPLGAEWICPTHGPVWHKRVAEVAEIVDRLSKYESEEGVTIVYGTMYGNTAEAAEIIAARLVERGVPTVKIHDASHTSMSELISDAYRYRGLIVGSPTYNAGLFPPVAQFMDAMTGRGVKGKVYGAFGNFGWASAAARILMERGEALGWDCVGGFTVKMGLNASSIEDARRLADQVADRLEETRG